MIKVVYLVRRKQRLRPKAFQDHWLNTHAPLAASIPGLREFRINTSLEPGDPIPTDFDGIAEMLFDNRKVYPEALQSPEWEAVRQDALKFIDSSMEILTREHIIVPLRS